MNYDVVFGSAFKRCVKKLKKRYPSVIRDVETAIEVLLNNPLLGVLIPGGSGIRKLRIRNSDAKRGKSGSYRMLYYFEDQEAGSIFLLLLYAKSDKENVQAHEIQRLLDDLNDKLP
ncbi:putative toxin-antitoxin system, toxin component, RelE/RelB-like [Desulfonema limicola]|uniref:Toxin-antitoxin system, toxin component, RelE/RelB-like n=1 Tax=Desulfonema limicola TaxID=45656 RepID=A0A975B8S1_9BACT|nr:type II toxin-antitoxin system RelE/ParE family toxin [Desulfonema limicola]QTA80917.1 putative toxin-antitoxin system, toxin component, RelE/RelB-like [Desulfonema limicola]